MNGLNFFWMVLSSLCSMASVRARAAGFQDVGRDADRRPGLGAVGGLDPDADPGLRRLFRVEHPDLVVRQAHPGQFRIERFERTAQGPVQGVDGAVALRGRDPAFPVDVDDEHGRGVAAPVAGRLVLDDGRPLELEERLVFAEMPAHEEFERRLGALVLIAFVLHILEQVDDCPGLRGSLVDLGAYAADLRQDRAPARHLGCQETALVADRPGIHVLERVDVLEDGVDVHAPLVGESAFPDVRQERKERHVGKLGDQTAGGGKPLEAPVGEAGVGPLHLERRDDGREVGVAAALADSDQGALDVRGAGLDGHDRVGHGHPVVVVAVDADRKGERPDRLGREIADLRRERASVRVAEDEAIRAALGRGLEGPEGVGLVGLGAVEEVLGVEDDLPAFLLEEGHRVADHVQVLLERGLEHPGDVEIPALAEEDHDRRLGPEQRPDVLVVAGLLGPPSRAPERRQDGPFELQARGPAEELQVLGVRPGIPGFDVPDAQVVQDLDDPELVADGKGDPLPLGAVPQRGIKNRDRAGHRRPPVRAPDMFRRASGWPR